MCDAQCCNFPSPPPPSHPPPPGGTNVDHNYHPPLRSLQAVRLVQLGIESYDKSAVILWGYKDKVNALFSTHNAPPTPACLPAAQPTKPFSFCSHAWIYDPASKARILQLENQMQQLEAWEQSLLGVSQ